MQWSTMMEKAETEHWGRSIRFESLNLGERERMILKRILLFQDTISSNNVVLKLLPQTSTANNYHQIYFSQIGFYWMLEKTSAIIHLQDSQDSMQPGSGVQTHPPSRTSQHSID